MLNRSSRVVPTVLALSSVFDIARADTSGPDEPFRNAREATATVVAAPMQSVTSAPVQSFVDSGKQQAEQAARARAKTSAQATVLDRFDTELSN